MKTYQQLLDLNPTTTDEANFAGWSHDAVLAHMAEEREAVAWGSPGKNHIEAHWKMALHWIEKSKPIVNYTLDLPAERERGRVDVIRAALQVIHWIIAVRQDVHRPPNLLPRFPTLVQPRERPAFKVAEPTFKIADWLAAHRDTLIDTGKVRVVEHEGRARLRVLPGALSDADLKIARSWTNVITAFIADQFVDVDADALNGLMRAA